MARPAPQLMGSVPEKPNEAPARKFKVPEDVHARWVLLQAFLGAQVEFETRFPAAHDVLFPDAKRPERSGLLLPSFGIRVMRWEPLPHIGHAKGPSEEGDAYSATYLHREIGPSSVDQGFEPIDPTYLRGLLLAILGREEYAERVLNPLEGLQDFDRLPVRITDLRLAMNLRPGTLTQGLHPILELLPRPITTDGVVLWKRRMLGEPFEAEAVQNHFENDNIRVAAVSFAAAALFLFLDFDMPGLERATSYRLTEQIEGLAEIIGKLRTNLKRSAGKLEHLLANRSAGNQPHKEYRYYLALKAYRLGEDEKTIAQWYGINPRDKDTLRGTSSWKKKLREEVIARGVEVEKERFPRAAAIFANKDDPHVERKAREAYRAYSQYPRPRDYDQAHPATRHLMDQGLYIVVGKAIRVNYQSERGLEVIEAYMQLGSCLVKGISPFP
jgi:hypothetical protein